MIKELMAHIEEEVYFLKLREDISCVKAIDSMKLIQIKEALNKIGFSNEFVNEFIDSILSGDYVPEKYRVIS